MELLTRDPAVVIQNLLLKSKIQIDVGIQNPFIGIQNPDRVSRIQNTILGILNSWSCTGKREEGRERAISFEINTDLFQVTNPVS